MKQIKVRATGAFFYFFIAIYLTSCDTNGNSNKKEDSINQSRPRENDTNNSTTQIALAPQVANKIYVLYLKESEFRLLITSHSPHSTNGKLAFQFSLTNVSDPLTLTVWPFQGNNYREQSKITLHNELRKWPLDLANSDILGGLKLRNQAVNFILTGLTDADDGEVVAFAPKRQNGSDRITFDFNIYSSLQALKDAVSFADSHPINAINELKPSPPASDDPNTN